MGGGIFSSQLDGHTFSIMLAILVGFTLLWEEATERLEHAVHDLPHYMHILEKIYRELTMLGFVSLFIVLGKEFMHLNDQVWSIPFEFAHLLSFTVAILYSIVAIISIRRLMYTKTRWDRIAGMNVQEVCRLLQKTVDEEEALYGEEDRAAKRAKWPWKSMWTTIIPFSHNYWEDVEWHLLRSLFLREFKMGLEFDYSKYMRLKLLQTLTMNLDVGGVTWSLVFLTMCAFIGADMAYNGNQISHPDKKNPGMLAVLVPWFFGWGCVVVQVFVLVMLKKKIHHLLELFGCEGAAAIPRFLQELNAHIEIRNQVRFITLFKDAGTEFLDALVDVLEVEFHQEEHYLAKQGEMGSSMFLICKGSCRIVNDAEPDANKQVLGYLRAGDYTGEMSILLSEPRSMSIVVNENSVICILPADKLPELEATYPAAVRYMKECALARKNKGQWDDQSALTEAHVGHSDIADGQKHSHGEKSVFMQKAARKFKVKGPVMDRIDEVWDPKQEFIVRTVIEYTLLFQCFYVAYFWLHLATAVNDSPDIFIPAWVVAVVMLLPTVLTVFLVSPTTTRYFCLLVHTMKKDNVTIASVAHSMSQVIELRNMIMASLFRSGLQKSQEAGLPADCTSAELACFVFEVLDRDDGGTLDSEELRTGLPDFGVFLTKPEFKVLMRFIDPDKTKVVSLEQWRDFMMASDEELATHKFHHKEIMRMIKTALLSVLESGGQDAADNRQAGMDLFATIAQKEATCTDSAAVPFKALQAELRMRSEAQGNGGVDDGDFEHLAVHLETSVHAFVQRSKFLDFIVSSTQSGDFEDDTSTPREGAQPKKFAGSSFEQTPRLSEREIERE